MLFFQNCAKKTKDDDVEKATADPSSVAYDPLASEEPPASAPEDENEDYVEEELANEIISEIFGQE